MAVGYLSISAGFCGQETNYEVVHHVGKVHASLVPVCEAAAHPLLHCVGVLLGLFLHTGCI